MRRTKVKIWFQCVLNLLFFFKIGLGILGIENSVLRKKVNHNGVQTKSEMPAILYIISSAEILNLVLVRRFNKFSAQIDPAENENLEN